MKKILALTFADPRTQGGIEGFNRMLKKFYPNELVIITYPNDFEKIYNVPDVIEVGSRNFIFRVVNKLLKNRLRENLLKKIIKESKADVIILVHPNDLQILKDIKIKKILVQHTSYESFIRDFCHNNEEEKKLVKEKVDCFVTLSKYDAERFQKELRIEKNKIATIRHSSMIELLETKKEKNKNLVMIGRIDNSSKRFDLAIKSMKKLPDYILNIYGGVFKQEDMDFLQEIIKNENIKNVYFKGITNNIQEKLDKSGIFIMTSDYEGYGIANIEAMRRGLPIILRNTFDSAQDIVMNNGVLLAKEWNEDKFIEAVKKVYKNYKHYSENSKRLGKRYDFDKIKKEWEKVINDVIKEK